MTRKEKLMALIRARIAAGDLLEIAAMHYAVVAKGDWEEAEVIAQKLAEQAAVSADGALLMGQMEDE